MEYPNENDLSESKDFESYISWYVSRNKSVLIEWVISTSETYKVIIHKNNFKYTHTQPNKENLYISVVGCGCNEFPLRDTTLYADYYGRVLQLDTWTEEDLEKFAKFINSIRKKVTNAIQKDQIGAQGNNPLKEE